MTRKHLLNLPSLIYHLSTLAADFVSSITLMSQAASNHADALFVILLISCVGLKIFFLTPQERRRVILILH